MTRRIYRRWRNLAFFRGRRPYTGDRIPSKANTYFYEGYQGENFGDELIFETVSGFLMPAHPRFVGRFEPPFQTITDLVEKRKISAAVVGGGSVSPNLMLQKILRSKTKFSLHTFGIGKIGNQAVSGDLVEKRTAEVWKKLLDVTNCKFVNCRGPLSKIWFDSVGIPARATADTAFAAFDFLKARQNDFIAVNFGRHFFGFEEDQLKFYRRIVDILLTHKTKVLIIPLHHIDLKLTRILMQTKGGSWGNSVRALDYIPTVLQFRSLLPKIIFGVGERLHFSIPLLASGIPSVMLAYSIKHIDVSQSIFCHDYVVEHLKTNEACNQIDYLSESILNSGSVLSEKVLLSIDRARDSVRELFAKSQCNLNDYGETSVKNSILNNFGS